MVDLLPRLNCLSCKPNHMKYSNMNKKSSFKIGHFGKFSRIDPAALIQPIEPQLQSNLNLYPICSAQIIEQNPGSKSVLRRTLSSEGFGPSNIGRFVDWFKLRNSSYHICVQMIVWILNDKERSGQSLNLGMSKESLKWRLLVLIFTSWLKTGLMTGEVVSTATVEGTISMINIL